MDNRPYFCPNCRSNRFKFNRLTTYSQSILKDAVTGEVMETGALEELPGAEATIQCRICQFTGNEMRFVKQAEREPRRGQPTVYS